MAKPACLQLFAAFFIRSDEGAALPVLADFHLVVEEVRSPAEVLEVVSVDTLGLVVLVVKGTPLSFEVEHEEIVVLRLHRWN